MTKHDRSWEQAERYVADLHWVSWSFDVEQTTAEMRLDLSPLRRGTNGTRARAKGWAYLQFFAVLASVITGFAAMIGLSWAAGAVFLGFCAMSLLCYFRSKKLFGMLREFEQVNEISVDARVSDRIESTWTDALENDADTQVLAANWFRLKREIEHLERLIDDGVQARKRLSPVDPMRKTMQVEIEVLRSRRDGLRTARQEDAERITGSSQMRV